MASGRGGDLYLADLDLEAEAPAEASAPLEIRRPVTRDTLDLDFEDDEASGQDDPGADGSRRAVHSFDALPAQARPAPAVVDDDELDMHTPEPSAAVLPSTGEDSPSGAPTASETDASRPRAPSAQASREAAPDIHDEADTPRASAAARNAAVPSSGIAHPSPLDASTQLAPHGEDDADTSPPPRSAEPKTLLYKSASPGAETTDVAEEDILHALNHDIPDDGMVPFFEPPSSALPDDLPQDLPDFDGAGLEGMQGADVPPEIPDIPGLDPLDHFDSTDGLDEPGGFDDIDGFDSTGEPLPPPTAAATPDTALADSHLQDSMLPEDATGNDFAWGTPGYADADGNAPADASAQPSHFDDDDDELDAELDVRDLHAMPWGYPHAESGDGPHPSPAPHPGDAAPDMATSPLPANREKIPEDAADSDTAGAGQPRRESSDSDVFVQGFFQTLAADLPNEPGMNVRLPHSAEGLTLDAIAEDDILASLAPLPPPPARPADGDAVAMPSSSNVGSGAERSADTPPSPPHAPTGGRVEDEPEDGELHDLIHALGFDGDSEESAYSESTGSDGFGERQSRDASDTLVSEIGEGIQIPRAAGTGGEEFSLDADMQPDLALGEADFPTMPEPSPRGGAGGTEDDGWRSSADLPRPPGTTAPDPERASRASDGELPDELLSDIPLPGTPGAPAAANAPLYQGDDMEMGGEEDAAQDDASGAGKWKPANLLGTLRDQLLQPFLLKVGRLWKRGETPPPPTEETAPAFDPEQFQLGFEVGQPATENLADWHTDDADATDEGTSPATDRDWGDSDEDLLDFSVPHTTAPGAATVTHPAPLDLPLHPDGLDGEEDEEEEDILAGPLDVESAFPEAMDESAAFKQRLSLFDEFDEDDGAHDEKYDDIDALKSGVAQAAAPEVAAAPSLTWREKWEILRGFLGVVFGGVARKVSDMLNLGENWWMYVDAIAILILVISLAVIAASLIWF